MIKRMTESQIVATLQAANVAMEVSEVRRFKALEEAHQRLKPMHAELSLKSQMQEAIIKKL